jgi:hypothetical protein
MKERLRIIWKYVARSWEEEPDSQSIPPRLKILPPIFHDIFSALIWIAILGALIKFILSYL